jgi:hypothetical protein
MSVAGASAAVVAKDAVQMSIAIGSRLVDRVSFAREFPKR